MTVGNVVAVAQSNLKRMLAYSSIAHVGYMLVGLVAGGAARRRGGALLPAGLHVHHGGRLRGDPPVRARAAARRWTSATMRAWPRRHPLLAAALGALSALARRYSAAGRLLRQVLRVRRRGARRLPVAGRDRRAELGGGRLLLPARHRLHVHARAGRGARRLRARPSRAASPSSSRGRHRAARRDPRAVRGPRPGRRLPAVPADARSRWAARRRSRRVARGLRAFRQLACPPRLAPRSRRHRLPRRARSFPGAARPSRPCGRPAGASPSSPTSRCSRARTTRES